MNIWFFVVVVVAVGLPVVASDTSVSLLGLEQQLGGVRSLRFGEVVRIMLALFVSQ